MIHVFSPHGFDAEMVRLAVFLSAVISLLVYERYGLSTGGTIVAGYLALFIPQPSYIAITLLMSLMTYVIVHKWLRPRLMLWGRRLYVTEMAVALALNSVWFAVLLSFTPLTGEMALLFGIGLLLPGILAHDMGRQGVRKTLWISGATALAIFALLTLIGALRPLLGMAPASAAMNESVALAYPPQMLLVAVCLSMIANIVLYYRLGGDQADTDTAIRTGGFVTAAYLALLLARPFDLLIVLVCSALTYLIVVHGLMKWFIVFGRMKLNAMFMIAFLVTALFEGVLGIFQPDLVAFSAFNAIVPTLVALLANDSQRQGIPRTLIGAGAATVCVALVMGVLTGWLGDYLRVLPLG
jgi:poly-gamma-glutamate biosynthesis protein PgsC/CapC